MKIGNEYFLLMKVGDLVIPRVPWGMNSNRIGLVIEKSLDHGNGWIVLWTKINGYQLQCHIDDALLVIAEKEQL